MPLRCLHTKKEQEQNTLFSITHIVQSLETGFIPVLYIFQVLDEVAMMKRMQKQIEQLESELAKLRGSQVNFLNFILANTEFFSTDLLFSAKLCAEFIAY